jgi:lysyl-tRNA synthetase class 2
MSKDCSMIWQPSCSLSNLKARAEFYSQLRAFFFERNVLEVETPILGRSTATDPHLDSLSLDLHESPGANKESLYLHTSPEFPMKRLLASGSGPIFQICKTFRNAETGSRHNPEFSMLEWYRPGFDLKDLQQETAELVSHILGECEFQSRSYRELFREHLDIDPMQVSLEVLRNKAKDQAAYSGPDLSRDEYLDLLISICIEPALGRSVNGKFKPLFVSDYPASQASLAALKKDENGFWVAERFELYIDGLEIANAYHELTNAAEQRRRFEADNQARKKMGFEEIPLDKRFLAALESGMPDCSGIALGLDRLLMIKVGAKDISEVLSFPLERV